MIGGMVAVRRGHFDDVAEHVLSPWIGGILLCGLPVIVVSEDYIDAAGHRVRLHVFGPVHTRCAERVGGKS
jgi:hypothetical protein